MNIQQAIAKHFKSIENAAINHDTLSIELAMYEILQLQMIVDKSDYKHWILYVAQPLEVGDMVILSGEYGLIKTTITSISMETYAATYAFADGRTSRRILAYKTPVSIDESLSIVANLLKLNNDNDTVRFVREYFYTADKFEHKLFKLLKEYSIVDETQSLEEIGAVGQARLISLEDLKKVCRNYIVELLK